MKEAGSHKWANLNQRPLVIIDGVSLVIIIIIKRIIKLIDCGS